MYELAVKLYALTHIGNGLKRLKYLTKVYFIFSQRLNGLDVA
jgi:hypothetical protein